MRRRTGWLLLLLLLGTAGSVGLMWQRDMQAIEARLAAGAQLTPTPFGPVAHAEGGEGAPVLAIHGAGGGHDQGRLLAEAFLPEGYRWIAPSRFGYPGTPMPADASTAAQADALAALLEARGIDRVAVIAISGGVPPALQFAARHPERVQALILLAPAPHAPLTAEEQALPVPLWLYDALFATDLPLWALLRVATDRLAAMVDARPELTAAMSPQEAEFLEAMISGFLPVTQRREGLANEGAAIAPGAAVDLPAIAAPALIVHARDDRIAPFATAVFTAEGLPRAETLFFESGGHLLLGHHAAVRARIAEFLALHAPTDTAPGAPVAAE